jgi:RNA 3'-terminal phosphate cyclase (ATP)
MSPDVVIDGGAGGGQMLRSAVALAAVSGRSVRVTNIRGSRPKPGLRAQHLTAVRAAARVCRGELTGAELGSREVEFRPGEIQGRTGWRLDVGTAGSVTLVLQCLLPALALAPTPSELTLTGGTDVPFAPPFDYFEQVFLPAVRSLGARVDVALAQRGFYPKGGGQVQIRVSPATSIAPATWLSRGEAVRVAGRSYSQGLASHIPERMRTSALRALAAGGRGEAEIELEVVAGGRSEGCGIALWAECEDGRRLGGSALGRRGRRAEEVGEEAARVALRELASGTAVDGRLADQMIAWMALATGASEISTAVLTDHIRSACYVTAAMTGAQFSLDDGPPARVRCQPAAQGGWGG